MRSRGLRGASADAVLLTAIKLVTLLLNTAITRLLSDHLTKHDYGTYSQVMLLINTLTYLTVFGMVDGVNYYNCSVKNPKQRESYVSTVFCLQCMLSAVCGTVLMLLQGPICAGFDNPDVKKLLIYAASLPLLQNLLSMLQVLLVSVGKARMLAVRNLLISLLRLLAVIVVVNWIPNVAVILLTTLVLDIGQILIFGFTLRRNSCGIRVRSVNLQLTKQILQYCIPMGVYLIISTLNRDLDKYLIAWMTDTETVALYSNASKMLPFDIIMSSFCTVLQPRLTKRITEGKKDEAIALYRAFIEIAYVTTAILCFAVLAAGKQVMELLYTEKYLEGLPIFCVYILVDLVRFSNFTMVIAAAGKTKKLMLLSVGAVLANGVLNLILIRVFGIIGPAVATLAVTAGLGLLILYFSAKELDTGLHRLFDLKYFLLFTGENLLALPLFFLLGRWLERLGVHYLPIIGIVCGLYCVLMFLLHVKRLLHTFRQVNRMAE